MIHTNNSMQSLSSSQVAQPQDTLQMQESNLLLEPLNPTVLMQYGGVSVAVILAVSILILTLAEFTKVVIGATSKN